MMALAIAPNAGAAPVSMVWRCARLQCPERGCRGRACGPHVEDVDVGQVRRPAANDVPLAVREGECVVVDKLVPVGVDRDQEICAAGGDVAGQLC
jgi:hypothetical protein